MALGDLACCKLENVTVYSLLSKQKDIAENIGKNSSHADLWETPQIPLHLEKWQLTFLYNTYSLTRFQAMRAFLPLPPAT